MSTRLAKDELQALMAAMEQAHSSDDDGPDVYIVPDAPFVDDEKKAAAMGARSKAAASTGPDLDAVVSRYDLLALPQPRTLDRVLPALAAMAESAAGRFAADLSAWVGGPVRIRTEAPIIREYGQAQAHMDKAVVDVALDLGGSGQALLLLDRRVAIGLIHAALGDGAHRSRLLGHGTADTDSPTSGLTNIERAVLFRLLDQWAQGFSRATAALWPAGVRVVRTGFGAPFDSVAVRDESAVLIDFSATSDGRMRLVLPRSVLEPVTGALVRAPTSVPPDVSGLLARVLERSDVNLTAVLGHARLSLAGLLKLREGDVIPLSQSQEKPLLVQVEGKNKMTAWSRAINGRLAIEIVTPVRKPPHRATLSPRSFGVRGS